MIIWQIALRNLKEHKTKTLIIGVLITSGILLLVLGNSFMDTITTGMEESFSANFTGDFILREDNGSSAALIGGGFQEEVPLIENYDELVEELEANDITYTSLLSGMTTISISESMVGMTMVWGISSEDYFSFFNETISIVEGQYLESGKNQIMLTTRIIEEIEKETNRDLHVGDNIELSMSSDQGTKIREVEIAAIFNFNQSVGQLQMMSFINATTFRSLAGLTDYNQNLNKISDTDMFFGNSDNEEDLFGDSLISSPLSNSSVAGKNLDIDNILGDTSVRAKYQLLDNSAWHFILLDSDQSTESGFLDEISPIVNSINANRTSESIDSSLKVENWRWGAGMMAELVFGLQIVFNVIILIISIVAIIIIMNTIVISVMERIAEIGTIRAIGGQKSFVRQMITTETLVITIVFGSLGIAIGAIIILLLNLTGIHTTNEFLVMLFGGNSFFPKLSGSAVVYSLFSVMIIGLISSLYPASVALRIEPVRAMQK